MPSSIELPPDLESGFSIQQKASPSKLDIFVQSYLSTTFAVVFVILWVSVAFLMVDVLLVGPTWEFEVGLARSFAGFISSALFYVATPVLLLLAIVELVQFCLIDVEDDYELDGYESDGSSFFHLVDSRVTLALLFSTLGFSCVMCSYCFASMVWSINKMYVQ